MHRGTTKEIDSAKDTRVISTEETYVPKHASKRKFWTFGEDRSQFGWSESVRQARREKSLEIVYNFKLSKGLIAEDQTKNATASSASGAAGSGPASGVHGGNAPFSSKTFNDINNPLESAKSRSVRRLMNLEASDLKLEDQKERSSQSEQQQQQQQYQQAELNSPSTEDVKGTTPASKESANTEAEENGAKAAFPEAQKKPQKANLWKSRSSKSDPKKKQASNAKSQNPKLRPKPSSSPEQSSLPSHTPTSPLNSKSSPLPKRMTPFSNDTFQLVLVTSVETFGKSELSLPTNNTLAMFSFFQRHFSFRALVYTNSKRVKRACDALDIAYDSHYEC